MATAAIPAVSASDAANATTTATIGASRDASAAATRITIGAVVKRNSAVRQRLLQVLMEVRRGRMLGWTAIVARAVVGTVEEEPRQ